MNVKKEDEILYQAYLLIKKADIHEKAEEFISAIYKYQKSAEILKQYGLGDNKIEEITTRISELDNLYELQKKKTTNPEKLEKMAFEWIECEKDLKIREKYHNGTICYEFAVELLIAAGWNDSRLEQFRKKNQGKDDIVKNLYKKSQEKQIPEPLKKKYGEIEQYTNRTQEFEMRKQTLNDAQNRAFGLIDKANKLINKISPDYDKSIELYQQAYEFLIQAGWTSEAEYLNTMIENINQEQKRITEIEASNRNSNLNLDQDNIDFQQELIERARANKKFKEDQSKEFRKFQEQRKKHYAAENEAANLMNMAEKAVKIKNFSKAIELYNKATDFFKKIGFSDDQLALIQKEVEKMKVLQIQKEQEQMWTSEIELKKKKQNLMNKRKEERKAEEDLKKLTEISSMIKVSEEKKRKNYNDDLKKEKSSEEKQIMENTLSDLSKEIRKAAENVKKMKKN